VVDADLDARRLAGLRVDAPDASGRVDRPKRIHAVEPCVRAAIPELADIEDGVDDRRRMAPGHLAELLALRREDGLGHVAADLLARCIEADEVAAQDAGTSRDVIDAALPRAEAVRWIRELRQREQRRWCARAGRDARREAAVRTRMEDVVHPRIGAGVMVACRAGGLAVAPETDIPEQRLAEADGGVAIGDILVDGGGDRDWDGLERWLKRQWFVLRVGKRRNQQTHRSNQARV